MRKDHDAVPGTKHETLMPRGVHITRFSKKNPNEDTGKYFSPHGISEEERALASDKGGAVERHFVVLRPFKVETSKVTPWFDQPGKGIQHQCTGYLTDENGKILKDDRDEDAQFNIQNLIRFGYIKEI